MKLNKWNYEKHVYEAYEVPDEWRISVYETDMDALVNCCQCGKEIKFGETYTSQEVHTEMGFGFAVCPECYRSEMERRFACLDKIREEEFEKSEEGLKEEEKDG